jgi:hypothetical protein
MDYFDFQTLIVFYDGLFRSTKSSAVFVLRLAALASLGCGIVGLSLIFVADESAQSYLAIGRAACLFVFLVTTLWAVALVSREKRNE